MKDNMHAVIFVNDSVVNCFQKLLSSWWRTTKKSFINSIVMLWIAFKNYYLRDEGQQLNLTFLYTSCCELLSKIIIFVMKDNSTWFLLPVIVVVNCFQKLLSSWWRTTIIPFATSGLPLWIAFKNYYLRDEGQQFVAIKNHLYGCELLSKIIIFVMKDNNCYKSASLSQVVNCFQKLLSSWWRTTSFSK